MTDSSKLGEQRSADLAQLPLVIVRIPFCPEVMSDRPDTSPSESSYVV